MNIIEYWRRQWNNIGDWADVAKPITNLVLDDDTGWCLDPFGQIIWNGGKLINRITAQSGAYIDISTGLLDPGQYYNRINKKNGYSLFLSGYDCIKADELFEFFADNTRVEFSLIGTAKTAKDKKTDQFYITCSFDQEGDTYGSHIANSFSLVGTLRNHTHNHPTGDMRPSGLPEAERMALCLPWKPEDKGDDVGFAHQMESNMNKDEHVASFSAFIYVPAGSNVGFLKGGYNCYFSTDRKKINTKYSKKTAFKRYSII